MQNTTQLEPTYSAAAKAKSTPPPQLPPEYQVNMPALWDQKTLANYLGKSTAWCERARWAGEGPKYIKLGRHVRYKAEDVLAWIDASARNSSSAEG